MLRPLRFSAHAQGISFQAVLAVVIEPQEHSSAGPIERVDSTHPGVAFTPILPFCQRFAQTAGTTQQNVSQDSQLRKVPTAYTKHMVTYIDRHGVGLLCKQSSEQLSPRSAKGKTPAPVQPDTALTAASQLIFHMAPARRRASKNDTLRVYPCAPIVDLH